MVASSYIVSTQAPTTINAFSYINSTSTTVNKTTDWSNDGSGKYTYTGSIPGRFVFQLDFSCTPLASGVQSLELIKNGYVNNSGSLSPVGSWQSTGGITSYYVTNCTDSFVMNTNDYLQLYWSDGSSNSGLTTNITIIIMNVPYSMKATSYIKTTQSDTTITAGYINITSTTAINTSDWTNDGSGKYTYTGSVPEMFSIQVDFKLTGYPVTTNPYLRLVKNGIYNTISTSYPVEAWSGGSSSNGYVTQSSFPVCVMRNGDYLQLRWVGSTNSVTNLTISITVINTRSD